MDKVVYNLDIDEVEAMNYGVNRSDVTPQIQIMLRGIPMATFPKENSMDYTVRVWLPQNQIDDFSTILNTLIVTPKGKIPLSKRAKLDSNKEPSNGLNYNPSSLNLLDICSISISIFCILTKESP